jgi:DNA invertase Pin-like site-specific DNA recombinase
MAPPQVPESARDLRRNVSEFYSRIDEIENRTPEFVLAEDGKVSDTTCQGPIFLGMNDYARIGRE